MENIAYISSLVNRVRNNDTIAMQSLYESFACQMMASSYRITNNKADSEDIIQECFLSSFQKIGQLKEDKLYGAWLKRIVINQSLKLVKSRRNFEKIEHLNLIEDLESDTQWYAGIPFHLINDAILNLPEGCRQIFSLYLLEDYKHKKIAEVLNISISTSKSQYRYALKLLRDKLMPYNDE